jgi:hypothetical protein
MKRHDSRKFRGSVVGLMVGLVSVTGCGGAEMEEPSEPSVEVSDQAAEDSAYFDSLFPVQQDADDAQLQHPTPRVPIMVDGQLHAPETISRFNGRPVIYLMNAESQEGGFVYVFANPQQLRKHLRARGQLPRAEVPGVSAQEDTTPAAFFEDAAFEGNVLRLRVGYGIPNLKDHMMAWPWTWNDEISSVQAAGSGSHTVLYQNSNYWGTQVWLQAGTHDYDLSWSSFDNQTSSIKVLP